MSDYSTLTNPWKDWTITGRLGRGSFGSVYKIERNEHGVAEEAAMKIISVPSSSEELDALRDSDYDISEWCRSIIDDIYKEYSMMVQLKECPYVVRCDDCQVVPHADDEGSDVCIRMELLTPVPKYRAVYSDEDVIRLGIDICRALSECSRRGIIHRDIKPDNILVSKNSVFKLGDFGVAREMDHTTFASLKGTPTFMAPEVESRQEYGRDADIYSLGLVMYWLLNNRRHPFVPTTGTPTVEDIRKGNLRRLRGDSLPEPVNGSRTLKDIILKACRYDREERYSSADEMLADLLSLREGPIYERTKIEDYSESYSEEKTIPQFPSGGYMRSTDPAPEEGSASGEVPQQKETRADFVPPAPSVKKNVPSASTELKKGKGIYIVIAAAIIVLIGIIIFIYTSGQKPDDNKDSSISTDEQSSASTPASDTDDTAAAFAEYFRTSFENAEEIRDEWHIWFQGHDADDDGVPDMFVYSTGSPERFYVAAYSDGKIIDTEVHPQAAATISVYWLKDGSGFISDEIFDTDSGISTYRVIKYTLSGSGFLSEVLAEAHYREFSGDDTSEIDKYWSDREAALDSAGILSEEERALEPFEQAASYAEFSALLDNYGIELN